MSTHSNCAETGGGAGTRETYSGRKAFCIFWFVAVPLVVAFLGLFMLVAWFVVSCGQFAWLAGVGLLALLAWAIRTSTARKEAAKNRK